MLTSDCSSEQRRQLTRISQPSYALRIFGGSCMEQSSQSHTDQVLDHQAIYCEACPLRDAGRLRQMYLLVPVSDPPKPIVVDFVHEAPILFIDDPLNVGPSKFPNVVEYLEARLV